MAEEIGFENGRNSNFEGLVTLTLTLDPAIRHTVVHHPLPTYQLSFKSKKLFVDGRTDGRTFSPSNIIRSTFGSRPNNNNNNWAFNQSLVIKAPKFPRVKWDFYGARQQFWPDTFAVAHHQ